MTLKNTQKLGTVREKSEVKVETARKTVCKDNQGQNRLLNPLGVTK